MKALIMKEPPEVFYEKKMFLRILQNSQENPSVGLSLIYTIFKNAATATNKQTTTATITNLNKKIEKKKKKMMFNKNSSGVTMPSEIKPTRWIYVLPNLEGYSSVSQFFIFI